MTSQADDLILNVVGDQVALGPLDRRFLDRYVRWINDPGTVRTLDLMAIPLTSEGEAEWYEHVIRDRNRHFTIYERATMDPIGTCDIRDVDHVHRSCSIGMLIGEASSRGRGYGTEATRLLLDVAFTALGMHSVWLGVYSYNLAGIRAYEKAGFRHAGRRRESRLLNGEMYDLLLMDIVRDEFESPVLGAIFAPDKPRVTER